MKKFVSMALATAMIASMGSMTAFAKDDEYGKYNDVVIERTTSVVGDGYLYIPLRIKGDKLDDKFGAKDNEYYYIGDGNEDVNSHIVDMDNIKDFEDMKLKVTITSGKDYVKSCELNEIDDDDFVDFTTQTNTASPSASSNAWNGIYAIAIELEDFYEADNLTIKGTAKIQKSTNSTIDDYDFTYKVKNTSSDNIVRVDENKIESAPKNLWVDKDDLSKGVKGFEVDEDEVTITYPDFGGNVVDFKKGIEMLYMEGEEWNYEVKLSGQGKVALKFDNDSVKSVVRSFDESADLTFFNFHGNPKFDFTGTMTISLPDEDEDYYLYQIDEDGDLKKINARLNDDEDALEFKTRELTSYVLSDVEYDKASSDDEEDDDVIVDEDTSAPVEGDNVPSGDKNIPTTGSEDFVGVAVALAAVSAAAAGAVTLKRKKD